MTAAIREAFIVLGLGEAEYPVAGVPLLIRTILTLQRTGIERCTLVGPVEPPSDRRIRCDLASAPVLVAPEDPALRLVVGAGAVIDGALVRNLQDRARPGEVIDLEQDGARVRVAPGPLVAANGGRYARPTVGTLRSIASTTATLERTLLLGLENPRDGYLDTLLCRRLSRPLTRVLLRTPLSPNAVTVLGVGIGVVGGLLLGTPGALPVALAVACLVASAVLDCCDGELARLRFSESRLGHWLDITGDTLVGVAVLAGVVLRLARGGGLPGRPVLGLLLIGVLCAFAVITWSDDTEERRRRVPAWENRLLDGVLSRLTTHDWQVFVVAFALAGRLDLLIPAAAVGAQVFWVTVLVLLVRVLRRT